MMPSSAMSDTSAHKEAHPDLDMRRTVSEMILFRKFSRIQTSDISGIDCYKVDVAKQ
jgi:hypothetical protein